MHHLRHGCDVKDVTKGTRGMGPLLGYISKDMTKSDQGRAVDPATGEVMPTGRAWGARGDVPMAILGEYELTADDFATFCKRVNDLDPGGRSWYLSAISPQWAGFRLLGDGPLLMARLLEGLDVVEVET